MLGVGCVLIYLAIGKKFEPLLLLPMGFGCLLANLPLSMMASTDSGGLLNFFYQGVKHEILPPIIFMGVGALTDFGPLLANPTTLLLGAAAQIGVYTPFTGADSRSSIFIHVAGSFNSTANHETSYYRRRAKN